MSRGLSERPWPSRSSVITRLPRAASASASGRCISWERSRPCSRIRGRLAAGALLAVRPRTPPAVTAAGPPPNSVYAKRCPSCLKNGIRATLLPGRPARAGSTSLRCAVALRGEPSPSHPGGEPMAKQPRILAGETAAVTGAARGIGRATAEAFLGRGMRVAIGDVDIDAARRAAAELGPSPVAIALDVTDRASFTAFLDDTEEQLGPLDVLVNNAGIM